MKGTTTRNAFNKLEYARKVFSETFDNTIIIRSI
jgi:hypothetical protein